MINVEYTTWRPCPICHKNSEQEVSFIHDFQFFVDTDPPRRVDIRQVQCLDCAALYMNPAYTEKGMEVLFEGAGPSYGGAARRVREQVEWFLAQQEKGFLNSDLGVMDIGCGSGDFISLVPTDGLRLGVDIHEESILKAQTHHPGVLFAEVPFDRVLVPDDVDTVTMFHVLEHVRDPVGLLKQLSTQMQKSSRMPRLVIEVPIIERAGDGDICGLFSVQHMTHFSRHSLMQCLNQAGWGISEEFFMQGYNGYRVIAAPFNGTQGVWVKEYDRVGAQLAIALYNRGLKQVQERVTEILKHQAMLVLWGAGMHTEMLYQRTDLFKEPRSLVLLDGDPQKQGKTWRGHLIQPPELKSGQLVISSYSAQEEIAQMAMQYGFPPCNIQRLYETVEAY